MQVLQIADNDVSIFIDMTFFNAPCHRQSDMLWWFFINVFILLCLLVIAIELTDQIGNQTLFDITKSLEMIRLTQSNKLIDTHKVCSLTGHLLCGCSLVDKNI
jgi:hypothetical protein